MNEEELIKLIGEGDSSLNELFCDKLKEVNLIYTEHLAVAQKLLKAPYSEARDEVLKRHLVQLGIMILDFVNSLDKLKRDFT